MIPAVESYKRAFAAFQDSVLEEFMVSAEHARICALRADVYTALRVHFRPAVPAEFLRRYYPSGKGFRTSARVRAESEYRADLVDFKRAGMRAELAASLAGKPTAGVAEAERARLMGYKALVEASQDSVSAVMRDLPKPLPLDEEISYRAEQRRKRLSEEAARFRAEQRAIHRERVAAKAAARASAEAARASELKEHRLSVLRAEEQWIIKAGERSERVLTHYLQCLLGLRVKLTELHTPWALRVISGLQHAYSTWCGEMSKYGDFIDPYRAPVYDALWETVEILSVDGSTVTAYVDGSPFRTTVTVERAGGFCNLLRRAHGMRPIKSPGFTFFKMEELASKLGPLRPQTVAPAPEYEAWRARVLRAKTLPWHLLRPKRISSE